MNLRDETIVFKSADEMPGLVYGLPRAPRVAPSLASSGFVQGIEDLTKPAIRQSAGRRTSAG
jgi:hypothetical protein